MKRLSGDTESKPVSSRHVDQTARRVSGSERSHIMGQNDAAASV